MKRYLLFIVILVWVSVAHAQMRQITRGSHSVNNRVFFAQDGNERIESIDDGYMDYSATIAHRFRISEADIDVRLEFIGTSNSGLFEWLEDEDYFKLDDDLLLPDNEQVYFGTGLDSSILYNGTNMVIDPALVGTGAVIVGTTGEGSHSINGVSAGSQLEIHSEGVANPAGLTIHRHGDTNPVASALTLLRSRGSHASPTIVQDGSILGRVLSTGYDGTDEAGAAEIRFEVDGTPGDDDMPGRILLLTSADGAQTPLEVVRIDSSQNVGINKTPVTRLDVNGAITITELSTDPTDPVEGTAVFWKGDGTGTGDDGDLLYMEQSGAVVATGNLKWTDFVPSSITVNASDGTTGSVTDVQTMFDGNVYQIEELAATPGYDVEFVFSNVDKFPIIVVTRWLYSGSSTHDVTWDIWNYNSSAWDTLRSFQDSRTFEASMTMYIPRASNGNYVSAGAAKLRVYHRSGGNASHNIQVDYVGFTHSLQGVI